MRTISFIFAFAVLFLGPSLAGTADTGSLPGIGTFAFSGTLMQEVETPMVMAALR